MQIPLVLIARVALLSGCTFLTLLLPSGYAWSAQQIDMSTQMTPVKHQGSRNTCSVFAATALMEFLINRSSDREVDLSEAYNYWSGKQAVLKQNHLRSKYENMDGLAGFLAVEAYRSGSMLESEWPYESRNWQQNNDPRCRKVDGKYATTCFTGTPPRGSHQLRYALSPVYIPRQKIWQYLLDKKTPVIVNVFWLSEAVNNQTGWVRMLSQQEIEQARSSSSGHVITLVGYDAGNKRFKFRNSYGPRWGANGYGTIPERYIIEACEVCPILDRIDRLPQKEKDFVLRASMGVTGTLTKVAKGDELPAETASFERAVIRLRNPSLVYSPSTGVLQISASRVVLSDQKNWDIKQHTKSLYTLRNRDWKDFAWKINTATGQLYHAQHGEADKAIGKVTKVTGAASHPERINIKLRDAHIVYNPRSNVFQLVAAGKDIARAVNPAIRGWMNYYGAYQRSSLDPVLRHINSHLLKWIKRKYKKRGRSTKGAQAWLESVAYYRPELFAHWQFGVGFIAG